VRFVRLFPFVALALSAATLHAQRYRVLVGIAGTRQMSLIEFSPCIPAETSACGAWVNRVIDTASDSSFGALPSVSIAQKSPDRVATIAIQDGYLSVSTVVVGRGGLGRLIADPRRTATAVTISGDSRYGFAVLEAKNPDDQAKIEMIDFASRRVIASIALTQRPSGIAMAP
jgi:hypothetical protein